MEAEAFGATAWRPTVPVQVHYVIDDPLRNQQHVDTFAANVRCGGAPLAQYDYQTARTYSPIQTRRTSARRRPT